MAWTQKVCMSTVKRMNKRIPDEYGRNLYKVIDRFFPRERRNSLQQQPINSCRINRIWRVCKLRCPLEGSSALVFGWLNTAGWGVNAETPVSNMLMTPDHRGPPVTFHGRWRVIHGAAHLHPPSLQPCAECAPPPLGIKRGTLSFVD